MVFPRTCRLVGWRVTLSCRPLYECGRPEQRRRPVNTLTSLRDRAILSIRFQVGVRRAEIAALNVGNLQGTDMGMLSF